MISAKEAKKIADDINSSESKELQTICNMIQDVSKEGNYSLYVSECSRITEYKLIELGYSVKRVSQYNNFGIHISW